MENLSKVETNATNSVKEVKQVYVLSKTLKDKTVLETVYDPEKQAANLVVKKPQEDPKIVKKYQYGNTVYLPQCDQDVRSGWVKLASGFDIDISFTALLLEITAILYQYLGLKSEYYEPVARYILMTWVYDSFQKIPYLRVIGPWGSGKSRFLKIVGALSYHCTDMGAAVTAANIFRRLNSYPGTILLDEAEYSKTDQGSVITQILNVGYEKGAAIYRTEQTRQGSRTVRYEAFGPKVIAHRHPFDDDALESRLISVSISQADKREGIPVQLPASFEMDISKLRNKLMGFRLVNIEKGFTQTKIKGLEELEPRTAEIMVPLMWMFGEQEIPTSIQNYLDLTEADRISQLAQSPEGVVAAIVVQIYENDEDLSIAHIAEEFNNRRVFPNRVVNKYIGTLVKSLGLKTKRKNNGIYLDCSTIELDMLRKRYDL